MRVVEPEEGTGIIGAGAGAIGNLPGVGVGEAGGDAAASIIHGAAAAVVVGAFRVRLIENAVGVHAVGMCGVVFKNHFDSVSHFGMQDGTDNAEVGILRGARLERGGCGVGVLAVDSFLVDT